jgi:hypothetical protein
MDILSLKKQVIEEIKSELSSGQGFSNLSIDQTKTME